MIKAEVFIEKIDSVSQTVQRLMDHLRWEDRVDIDADVYLKLNLSSINPETIHCANTNIEVVESLIRILLKRTNNIFLCESNGMRFRAEEAFRRSGYDLLADRYGIKLVNFSNEPQVYGAHPLLEGFSLPKVLLESNKVLISLPLIKTHAITKFSGASKNQWGLISRYDRILLHKNMDDLIPIINRLVRVDFAIMGGPWAMEGRGPTNGKPRNHPVMFASDKIVSLDASAMRSIGIEPSESKHILLGQSEELGSIKKEDIKIVGDYESIRQTFEPARYDWALRLMNGSSKNPYFVHRILLNQNLFVLAKKIVNIGRRIGFIR